MSSQFHSYPLASARRYRPKVHLTEVTTVWNDGCVVKVNCFGELEHRSTVPLNQNDPQMQEFFAALDGMTPAKAAIVLRDPDAEDFSL